MSPLTFTFRRLQPGARPNAYLGVRITNPHNARAANAIGLVDTGAAECSIPDWLALQLGHDLHAGVRPATVQTASGTTKAWKHTAGIQIMDSKGLPALTLASMEVRVLPGLPFVLLGVAGVLEKYRLTVDYPRQTVTLE